RPKGESRTMEMELKSMKKCDECEKVKEKVIALQYDPDEDGAAGEITLCAECVDRYIQGEIKFI
ncbi:hypothetical protein, partial [Paenibacillus popilliae]